MATVTAEANLPLLNRSSVGDSPTSNVYRLSTLCPHNAPYPVVWKKGNASLGGW